jgi:hypothetical protein
MRKLLIHDSSHYKHTTMTSKNHLVALSLVAAALAFSPRPSSAAPTAAPAPYVSIASLNASTPAFYNVATNTVASLIYARSGSVIKITVNGVTSSDTFYNYGGQSQGYLPAVAGPATISVTAGDTNGAIATIAVTPIGKTTAEPLPR